MSQEKGTVLIVEDEDGIRMYMEEIFGGEGFRVATAENGLVALERLRGMDVLPTVIFLDLMMPVMDGQRFLHEIQKNPVNEKFKNIPVVIVSARRSEVIGTIAAYVYKPPDLEVLVELAEKYSQAARA